MMMDASVQNTLIGALIAAVAAMAAWIKASMAKQNAKHELCETDRDAIKANLATVKEDVALFKSCPVEPCGAREAFRRREAFAVKGQ